MPLRTVALRSSRVARGAACIAFVAVLLGGCSDDDDEEPTPAEVCTGACGAQVAGCVQSGAAVQGCSVACQFGFTLAPACSAAYRAALACVGGRPFLTCTDQSITVSAAIAECTDEIAAYFACVPGSVLPCLDTPLGDSQCTARGMPPRSRLCLGTAPAGCQLFEGSVRVGEVGSFCCP